MSRVNIITVLIKYYCTFTYCCYFLLSLILFLCHRNKYYIIIIKSFFMTRNGDDVPLFTNRN